MSSFSLETENCFCWNVKSWIEKCGSNGLICFLLLQDSICCFFRVPWIQKFQWQKPWEKAAFEEKRIHASFNLSKVDGVLFPWLWDVFLNQEWNSKSCKCAILWQKQKMPAKEQVKVVGNTEFHERLLLTCKFLHEKKKKCFDSNGNKKKSENFVLCVSHVLNSKSSSESLPLNFYFFFCSQWNKIGNVRLWVKLTALICKRMWRVKRKSFFLLFPALTSV